MIMRTASQFANSTVVRLPLAFALTTSLILLGIPRSSARAAAADLNLKSQAQLRSEAALYDTAIREIGRISNMQLSNPNESKAALAILKQQTPNLRFSRSKLITIGLSDSGFANAVTAKAGNDKKSQQQFAAQLAQDRKSIFQVNGAESLRSNIIRSVEADAALLRKVSDQLSQASKAIKASVKNHHGNALLPVGTSPESLAKCAGTPSATISPDLDPNGLALIILVIATIVCPPLGIAIVVISSGVLAADLAVAITVALAEDAVQLVLDLKKTGSDDKQQKAAIQDCEDKANAADNNCSAAAEHLLFPFDLAAMDACEAKRLLDLAACLLNS